MFTLLAQSSAPVGDDAGGWFMRMMHHHNFVPMLAIIGGVAVVITFAMIRHRERMALIERGINPDAKKDEEPKS